MAHARQQPATEAGEPAGSRTSNGRRIHGLDPEQRRARRRTLLLQAAFELIACDGYANTSIEQICQTAYVGNKAFYELFDSKEACYLALLQQISADIEQRVLAVVAAGTELGEDQTVAAVVATLAHALVDDPRVAAVTFGEASGISPTVERQRRSNRRWAAQFLETLWRRHQVVPGTGSVPGHIDYHALAVSTIGGLFETIADWLHTGESENDGPANSIDTLIADLTNFTTVVRAGIDAQRAGRSMGQAGFAG